MESTSFSTTMAKIAQSLEVALHSSQAMPDLWRQLQLDLNRCVSECNCAIQEIGPAMADTLDFDSSASGRAAALAVASLKDAHVDALGAIKAICSSVEGLGKVLIKSAGDLTDASRKWPILLQKPQLAQTLKWIEQAEKQLAIKIATDDLSRCRQLADKSLKEAREVAGDTREIVKGAAFAFKTYMSEANMLYIRAASSAGTRAVAQLSIINLLRQAQGGVVLLSR
jgi:hypothetical protein